MIRVSSRFLSRRTAACVAALGLVLVATTARGDEVDDAFAQGNVAAADARWADAIEAYEQAAAIVPGRAPLLSYNLGTAYAHKGELGRATLHLRRTLAFDEGTTPEVVESARRNLALVRRRLEVEAEGAEARLSAPDDWRDVAIGALGSSAMGWLAIIAGWGALLVTVARRLRRIGEISTPISISLWVIFAVAFVGHALALGSDRLDPGSVLIDTVTVREGPGTHHAPAFELNRGSRVIVDDRRSSWTLVRLRSELTGWVPTSSVASVDDAR